jgi:hypothetical protein
MPVAQSTEAGRVVASNAHARRQQAAADAKRDSESLFGERPDTTTPLVGKAPLEDVPEPPKAPEVTPRVLVMSITILYRGRQITISSEGRSLDEFCDLLDRRLGAAS